MHGPLAMLSVINLNVMFLGYNQREHLFTLSWLCRSSMSTTD